MNNWAKAARMKLRVNTSNGVLSSEQIWDLNFSTLANLAKAYKPSENNDGLDFLSEEVKVDEAKVLAFELIKEVYLVKKAEKETAASAAAVKAHNQKILQLIANKQEESLNNLSVEELEKLLK